MAIFNYVVVLVGMILFSQVASTIDTITRSQPLHDDGRTTLVSEDGRFELGFFSPGSSTKRYVGIWYKKIPTQNIVWVANREKPANYNSSQLIINTKGSLVLLDQNETIIWVANSSTKALNRPIVQLLSSGNLIVRDEKDQNPQNYLWQSFDYPSDTLLPGMKLGWDLRTGLNRRIIAWNNWDDPFPGDFIVELMLYKIPEVIYWKGGTKYLRAPWNGLRFSGSPQFVNGISSYVSEVVSNKDEVYYLYNTKVDPLMRRVLNQSTYSSNNFIWIEQDKTWKLVRTFPRDNCDRYNLCGPNGNCVISELPMCQCLRGFKPKSPKNWDNMDWSEGCVRSEPWSCKVKHKDGFLKLNGLKLPDATHSWSNASMTLEECKAKCLENCSCTAYANLNVVSTIGCVIWFSDLVDIREMSTNNTDQYLYIRLATSETETKEGGTNKTLVIVIIASIVFALLMVFIFVRIYKSKTQSREENDVEDSKGEDMEIHLYDYSVIAIATNNFSMDQKLGQGGFGPVYKGTLVDGQEIAVKQLSKSSHQGMKEFKNEVILCSKLQHRNLVKVLGYCIKGEENMLIYEYMPNKSLDTWIFGSIAQRIMLDWSKRFQIICGIARGLLYLHQDSRLKIIHRDLKTSNVLLDKDLNPKISDFGLARIFGGDQFEENTKKVVGTYGYMAPEYAFHGVFSTKSDVFSFGILMLETVSGMKNRGLSHMNQNVNLIGHAWRLWQENMPMKLIDACLEDSYVISELLRCIHISLLCLQQHPDNRPNMASVVMMLSSERDLPQPKEPAFLLEKAPCGQESSTNCLISCTTNEMSFTELDAR